MRRIASIALLVCLVLGTGFIAAASAEDKGLLIRPLTGNGEETWITIGDYLILSSAAWSADGEMIAFNAYKDGAGLSPAEVWVVQRDGSGLRKVADGATPRWSPDGRQLIFKRDEFTNPGSKPGLYCIAADGSGEKFICEGRWPDWSPDGKRIVFSNGGEVVGGALVKSQLYLAMADGSEQRHLGDGDCPSWSPDGAKIGCCLLRTAGEEPTIAIVDIESGQPTTLGKGWLRPNWSRDNQSVVANGGGRREWGKMVRYYLDAQQPSEPLFQEMPSSYEPCISPDGQLLLFSVFAPR